MENIQSSSLKSKEEVIADLKEILQLINDGKEGYLAAEAATDNNDLKALFSKIAGERIVDESELKDHLALHGAASDNTSGSIIGNIHRAWLNVKQAFASKEDKAILSAVTTGERAVLEKYDACIADPAHADHLQLLNEQRESIQAALSEVEKRIVTA